MALAPRLQRIDHGLETHSYLGKAIFHPWRDLGVDLSNDQPVVFERAKLLGQHALGDPGHPPPQLAKALSARLQMKEDDALPFAVDQIEGGLDGTARPVSEIAAFHVHFSAKISNSSRMGTI